MICKHCYVVPKSLTKTLSNLKELERKLRFLFYSGLLLFKGNRGRERERVKGGRGQEQGNGDEDVGNGNGGDRDEGSKDEWKGSGGGTGTGGTKTERTGTRTGTRTETGETGRRGTGELERDPRFITTKKNKIKRTT